MISTQRLILVFIAVNMAIGMVLEIYNNPSKYSFEEIQKKVDRMTIVERDLQDESEGMMGFMWQKILAGVDMVMFPLKVIITLMKFFLWALWPFTSIDPSITENPVEQAILYGVLWLRSMVISIIAIEAYMFRINKKTS